MKYKVGDIVKLRDDLEHNKYYGGTSYDKGMNIMRNEPVEINHIFGKNYRVFDKCKERWLLTDEMIEGLWEECKPKLKLIDILNKIANGELKEGTKVKVFNYDFAKSYNYHLVFNEGELRTGNGNIFVCPCKDLNEECELIEPKHLPDVGKMAECFSNKGNTLEPTDNPKIEELDAYELDLLKIFYKLNEVIRYINK